MAPKFRNWCCIKFIQFLFKSQRTIILEFKIVEWQMIDMHGVVVALGDHFAVLVDHSVLERERFIIDESLNTHTANSYLHAHSPKTVHNKKKQKHQEIH